MASSSSNSAQAFSSRSWKYDVFISFRGDDTRKTFLDHLYSALVDRLIRVYKDDEALPRGDSIGPSLLEAIEESRIAVIVFSKNYADSSWCLDELAHIMKCKDEIGLIVMPIFYDVDPSEVRNQKRKFGEAFAKQEAKNVTRVELWRKALFDASNISGWEPKHIANGHEAKAIKEIVSKVHDRLFSLNLDVDEDLVGMTPRIQILKSLLEIGSGAVRMVGIWGVGGSGKTTLATSVCMEISAHFNGYYIVDNIREEFRRYGLKKLQENILSTVLKKEVKVQSIAEGKRKIKSIFCHSNVLILLDDVDNLGQLEALAGSHNWFGTGSRIIITTRDEHLLRTHRIDHVCPVRLLSVEESIRLFYKHAYNETEPLTDYEKLSLRVVSYAAGLPLALKVLGSFLFDKDGNEWESALAKLIDIPDFEIMNILKISYDGLEAYQKALFLHIACFFRWESTDDVMVMEILEACGFHPVIGIRVLRQKALVTIVDGRIDMHDLIQEMGHNIVRGEHPNNLEKNSRFRKFKEIGNMCTGEATLENDKIEAIQYYCSSHDQSSCFSKIISNMKKLRSPSVSKYYNTGKDDGKYVESTNIPTNELGYIKCTNLAASPFPNSSRPMENLKIEDLICDRDIDVKGPNFLSRYLTWDECPFSSFPDSFQPRNLVILVPEKSSLKELRIGYKHLPQLKVLKLLKRKNLLRTPDFRTRNRVFLVPEKSLLKEIRIGYKHLPQLKVARLLKMKNLPRTRLQILKLRIGYKHLPRLKVLKLLKMTNVLRTPDFRPRNFVFLVAGKSSLKELRIDYEYLPQKVLKLLKMKNRLRTSDFDCLLCLHILKLCKCQFLTTLKVKPYICLYKEPQKGYTLLLHLKVLQLLKMKNILRTPDLDGLPCLQKLKLSNCIELEEIHPSLGNHKSLAYVSVCYCKKLRSFPTIVQMEKLKTLEIKCCPLIFEFPEIQSNMESLVKLSLRRIWKFETQVETVFHQFTHVLGKMNLSGLWKLDLRSWGLRSYLEELNPSDDLFLPLGFSHSQFTLFKILCLTNCTRLVKLPELPSSVAILEANYCDSLRTIADCHTNCKWLCKVSLAEVGDTIDGGILPQSVLQGNAIENHSMLLQLEGIEITSRELLE